MTELWALLRDPRVSTVAVLLAVVGVGVLLVGVSFVAVSTKSVVPFQVPWLISAGFTGIGLVGTGLGLLSIHLQRVEAAEERRWLAQLQREALRLQQKP